jgi:hypothetical protein
LNERSEFTDAAALLSKDLLSVRCTDDDLFHIKLAEKKGIIMYLCASVCHTDIAARITFLSQLASEEFVELGAKNTISDKLSLLADLSGHFALDKKL